MKPPRSAATEWIWNLASQHFPGAMQIVDLFHARQHLWELARRLHPNEEAAQKRWMAVHQELLDDGRMKKLTVALRSIRTDNPGTTVDCAVRISTGVPRDSSCRGGARSVVQFRRTDRMQYEAIARKRIDEGDEDDRPVLVEVALAFECPILFAAPS